MDQLEISSLRGIQTLIGATYILTKFRKNKMSINQKRSNRRKRKQYPGLLNHSNIPILESSELTQTENQHELLFSQTNSQVLEKPVKDSTGNITNESLRKTKKRARTRSGESNLNTETCFEVILVRNFCNLWNLTLQNSSIIQTDY